jgi:hypothetical protein
MKIKEFYLLVCNASHLLPACFLHGLLFDLEDEDNMPVRSVC